MLEPGGSAELAVTRVEGDLHKIEPTERFGGFGAGEVKEVPFFVEHWMLSTSDVMPRFYLVTSGGQAAVIANTDTEDPRAFVRPLNRPEQVRRSASERNVVATAETRFFDNAAITDRGPAAVAAEILPPRARSGAPRAGRPWISRPGSPSPPAGWRPTPSRRRARVWRCWGWPAGRRAACR